VIIPTHDRPDLLLEAITSVRQQSVDQVEIIVVDDGSDPPIVVEDDIVLVRHDRPLGPAAARNAGVAAAHGRAVAFLDDDDLWLPNRLMLARVGLQRAPIAVCFSRFVHEAERTAGRGRMLEGDVSVSIREGMTPNLGQTAVRRSAWIPLDESLSASAEVDWWIRTAQEHRVATEPEVGFLYRVHHAPRTMTAPAARITCALRILDDHALYFSANRRAEAFHLFRLGLTARHGGDRRLARRALARSLRRHRRPRTAYHLLRSIGRSTRVITP
jgi:glycosyltransferase involved in cell wall biosynthesis